MKLFRSVDYTITTEPRLYPKVEPGVEILVKDSLSIWSVILVKDVLIELGWHSFNVD